MTSRYRRWAVVLGSMMLAVEVAAPANAACGARNQRMQVGVLPDVFLNYTSILVIGPSRGTKGDDPFAIEPPRRGLPPSGRRFTFPFLVRTKTFDHFWTGNLDLYGGDCNIYATVSVPGVGLAETYSACYPDNLSGCTVWNYPAAAAVGPAIADDTVKKWAMRVIANASADSGSIGAIRLFGLDCQGDICEPPPCLTLEPEQTGEFYDPPPPECLGFDPDAEAWRPGEPGIGDAYLVGRGNLYIGPRVQPVLGIEAVSDTYALGIDHWIANDNPRAIILVTPRGDHAGVSRYYGVQYDPMVRRWTVVAERDGAIIPAGSTFNVYVMGDRGPGFRVSSAAGGSRIPIDDELTNDNPNALLIVTRLVDDACQLVVEDGPVDDLPGPFILPGNNRSERWVCNEGYFEHPIGVEYDANAGRWAIVSSDGTAFPSPVAFNVFVAGLAGTYRSSVWTPGDEPDYAGRFEAAWATPTGATMEMPQLDFAEPDGAVFITNNLTPYEGPARVEPNLHPAGVDFDGSSWQVRNLDGGAMPPTAFNVVAPLTAP